MTRLGYQVRSTSRRPADTDDLFDTIATEARAADAAGFDTVLAMDHVLVPPPLGPPDHGVLECYTLLAALAPLTRRARLGALVTATALRNPALLAKQVTTLDIVSNGRAVLGIGAGWFGLEHTAFGVGLGSVRIRLERLEEALQIIVPMLRGDHATLDGRHCTARGAANEPPPISRVPVLIGGTGERTTLRLAAQYADASNLACPLPEVGRKLDALAAHCERFGRDRSTITVSLQRVVCVAPTHDEAVAELGAYLAPRGIDLGSPDVRTMVAGLITFGSPDEVGEALAAALATGVDGFTLSLPANGHVPERVALLADVARPVVG